MKKLPNVESAVIDIRKLRDYCLNPTHPMGKHKARIFKSELGIEQNDAELLKDIILSSLPGSLAEINFSDEYGTRYTANLKIRIFDKESVVTTGWIIRSDENYPRLITCYINT